MPHFGDYQNGIYIAGLTGTRPAIPTDPAALETAASAAMREDIASYVRAGCGDERTQDANVQAFAHWGLMPRMMVDTSVRDLSVELFGRRLAAPVFMAPVGIIGECGVERHGDLDAARAAAATRVPFCASTLSNDPLEDVAASLDGAPGWFQLYPPRDDALLESLVTRAEAAGFEALVVTLDCPALGWRPRDLDRANFPQLRGSVLANYFSDPVFLSRLERRPEDDIRAAVSLWSRVFARPMTWADIGWLRSLTRMPIVLKGICHPDDASRAVGEGADAVYCSNHGGRQANGGIPAIDMLPPVVDAVAGAVPVLFDSGVRSGTDVVKALALGASAVGIGRPYAWGLALGGTDGIAHVLRCVLAEADLLMAANGYPTRADLRREAMVRL